MTAYYNEFEPFAAAWLRELIADGLIAEGEVDERSILDVPADDLRGYDQCHFFAGIGGWSHALRLAGWPDDRPVWTGSCPCQPFSVAGKQKGHADERHLWPAFHALIAVCRPPVCFGEQVASKLGREWLTGVRADLEALGYACGAADLCAAGLGAPHIRQRLWWVADATDAHRWPGERGAEARTGANPERRQRPASGCTDSGLADASDARLPPPEFEKLRAARGEEQGRTVEQHGRAWWGDYIPCADGKARRIEPGIFPLAHGIPNRVGLLRGAGNAIVPQVAAEFVTAFLEIRK